MTECYSLVLRPIGNDYHGKPVRRLAKVLKVLGRSYEFRCVSCSPVTEELAELIAVVTADKQISPASSDDPKG